MLYSIVRNLYEKHVKGTRKDEHITIERTYLGRLHKDALDIGLLKSSNVFASSRTVKHLYDKRVAFEFFTILDHAQRIIENPDLICRNKPGNKKRGDLALIKNINGHYYVCLLENDATEGDISIITVHIIGSEEIPKFPLLLDTTKEKAPIEA